MESSRKLVLRGIGATPLVSIPINELLEIPPTTVAAVFFQVSWDVCHVTEMGVVQIEDHFVGIPLFAQKTRYNGSVLTENGVSDKIDDMVSISQADRMVGSTQSALGMG